MLALLIIHLILILAGGFFLSPEFVVYPYLTSHGFIPYVNLIDQHLPLIFFGPLSLPYWLVANRIILFSIFLTLIFLTDILFYQSLVKKKVDNPIFFTLSFIIFSWYFGGNFFWLSTFISFFISAFLFLEPNKKIFIRVLIGFILGLLILIKPTLLIAVFLIFIYFKLFMSPVLLGLALPFIITAVYLFRFDLFLPFIDLVLEFNSHYYIPLASKLSSLRQLVIISLAFIPFLFTVLKSKKILPLLISLSFLILTYPRFELLHLGPFILTLLYFTAQVKKKSKFFPVLFLILIAFIVLSLLKLKNYHYGDFYFNPETIRAANTVKELPGEHLVVLGGSELLYPLSGKLPPNYYLPPLPWYFAVPHYQQELVNAIIKTKPSIIYYPNASVDDISINEYTKFLNPILKNSYNQKSTPNYILYTPKK